MFCFTSCIAFFAILNKPIKIKIKLKNKLRSCSYYSCHLFKLAEFPKIKGHFWLECFSWGYSDFRERKKINHKKGDVAQIWFRNNLNKTCVINDPLGQTHSPTKIDHYFHATFVLFCNILKSAYGRTSVRK